MSFLNINGVLYPYSNKGGGGFKVIDGVLYPYSGVEEEAVPTGATLASINGVLLASIGSINITKASVYSVNGLTVTGTVVGADAMVVIAGQDLQLDMAGLGHIPALWKV